MSAYKSQTIDSTVGDAIAEAFGELQSLRDEMRETADNMESGGMGHMDKAQNAAAAADTLDSVADNEPDMPGESADLKVTACIAVQRRKGRGTSRAVRCENAAALLEGAVDALDTEMERLRGEAAACRESASSCEADADAAREDDPPDLDAAGDADSEAAAFESQADEYESNADEYESLRDELQNAIDEIGGVEFPGMYG